MDYPRKTLTRDGSALLANDDADGYNTVIDYVITSDELPDSSEELDDIEVGDFHNPQKIKIDSYQHQGSTFQPEATWDNAKQTIKNEYPIQMFGLLAHGANDNDSDETLLAVAVADGSPFIMPATNKVPFTFTMALTLTYSNASNVTADVDDTNSVTHEELVNTLKQYNQQNHQSFITSVDVANEIKPLKDTINSLQQKLSSNGGLETVAAANQAHQNIENELKSLDKKFANVKKANGNGTSGSLTSDPTILGVHSDNIQNPNLERTDGAVGAISGINGNRNDFDNKPIYKDIHRVNDDGNTMVRIPKFYIYKTMNGSSLTWKVSQINHGAGWYLPKCFLDSHGTTLPYVDVGAYDANDNGNGGLASQTGTTPLVNTTLDDFRNKARNTGNGYQQLDVHVYDVLCVLFTVEFATLNCQSVMKGYCYDNNASNAENNGVTDGGTGSSHTNSNGTMCWRGIENLYGNVLTWVDGISENGTSLYVCDDPSQYQTNAFAYPYNQVGYTDTSNKGFVSQLGFDSDNPEVNLPTEANGSSTTYFCDNAYVGNSGHPLFYVGSGWNYDENGGLFNWFDDFDGDTDNRFGARLIKKAVN